MAVPQNDGVGNEARAIGLSIMRGTAVEHYAGIDFSLKESSMCVVEATGKVVREVKIASEPEVLVGYFEMLGLPVTRIGLEACPLSQWLPAALLTAGRGVVCWRYVTRRLRFRR